MSGAGANWTGDIQTVTCVYTSYEFNKQTGIFKLKSPQNIYPETTASEKIFYYDSISPPSVANSLPDEAEKTGITSLVFKFSVGGYNSYKFRAQNSYSAEKVAS